MRKYFKAAAHGSAFWVVSAINDSCDAGLNDGASAHGAGLDGHVKGGAPQSIICGGASGVAERHDFRVGGRVTIADGAVISASQDLPVLYQDRAHGHFIRRSGG